MNFNDIAKFISEAGVLKLTKRTGFWMERVKDPESVAEHTFRAILIGYILAKLEGADEGKVLKMLVFHDMSEARTNDPHSVARRYTDFDPIEERVIEEQTSRLPDDIAGEIQTLNKEFNALKTKEAIVARDADKLEQFATVREYIEIGYKSLEYWLPHHKFRTESAKKLAEELEKLPVSEWWHGLQKLNKMED